MSKKTRPPVDRLLADVAEALNACERAGMTVKLKHGTVSTREGFVFNIDGDWAPRTLLYTEFSPSAECDNDGVD